MKRIARACWRISAALALALCASLAMAEAGHVVQAMAIPEPSAGYAAPATVPEPIARSTGDAVALPHARPRAVAASASTALAGPDVTWYRLEVPAEIRRSVTPRDLVFYLPRWQTIGTVAVYSGGRLAWRSTGSRVWNSFNRPLWVPLASTEGAPIPEVVWVRMASQPGVGGAVSTGWVGAADDLRWRWRVRSWLQTGLVGATAGAFVVVGLFSLAVWFRRREEPIYAVFFLASVTYMLRTSVNLMDQQPPWIPDAWFGWMTVNALAWAQMCVFAFAFLVHRKPMPRLAAVIVAMVVLGSLVTLPVPWLTPHLSTMLPAVYIVMGVQTALIAGSGLWAAWTSRSREALALFMFFSLNLPVGVHDLLLQNYRIDIERIYLGPYTAIGLFTIFLVIVWRRYVGAIREVEQVNASLEERLAARERELTASHEQLRTLEREQALAAERQRLMQDMHDGIGSSLMSALSMVQRGQASAADTAQVLKDCIDDLKLAIDSLHANDADLLALLAAVRFRLAPRLKAAGITLTWNVRDLPPLEWLDPQKALHVLRILQEVLTNLLKHSGANEIDVATAHVGEEVEVRVRDNGRAFVPAEGPATAATGHGLSNVRNRALALGARCQWAAWDGGGEFSLRLPVAG